MKTKGYQLHLARFDNIENTDIVNRNNSDSNIKKSNMQDNESPRLQVKFETYEDTD